MVDVPAKDIGWIGISANTLKFNSDNIVITSHYPMLLPMNPYISDEEIEYIRKAL